MNKETINDLTVSDLIEVLKQYPQNLPIRFNYTKDFDIWVADEYFDGDSANPNCPIIRAVVIT